MKRSRRTRSLVALLSFLLLSTCLAGPAKSRGKKKAKEQKEINICDLDRQQSPIYCFCNNNSIRNATDVNCWILSKFEMDDPMWSYFTSQAYLEKLTFTVRGSSSLSLDYIPTEILGQLKNLKIVTFQYAKIHDLLEHAFANLSSVTQINLSRNMIVSLRKYAFENMMELDTINLDENRIAEINRDIFINLPSLKKLYLNRNNITVIREKALKQLGSLEELELSGNQISVITRDYFHGLRSLQRLDLSSNLISMIGDRTFLEVPELKELELGQNEISYISEKAFDGMKGLRKLRLNDNKLATLEPDVLSGAPGLYFLDLRDNVLKTMTFDNIKPIVTNLYESVSHFYLDGNKLICDCRLAWIWGLRNETRNMKLRDALEELTCYLQSDNATFKTAGDDFGRNGDGARNPEEYADNLRESSEKDDGYLGDEYSYDELEGDDYEDSSSNSNSQPRVEIIEGKVCYVKHLFELKPEDLPCPEPSRQDLTAPEQPSSRHEKAPVGSSIWFPGSSAEGLQIPSYKILAELVLCLYFMNTALLFT